MRPELTQAANLLHKGTPEAVEEGIGLLLKTDYSFSMKVCDHPEDAEDTMQEVIYRSMGHLANIQDPQVLAVWLIPSFGIAAGACAVRLKMLPNTCSLSMSCCPAMRNLAACCRMRP
jgi:hypothetical protein